MSTQAGLFSLDDLTEDDAGTRPGFRLHRLELLNWGTFNKSVRTFRLDGENSLLTGDIGSGKSTIVDAITTLLLPANRIEYNKAAGAQKKERSLMSYVRGFHKSARSGLGDTSRPVALRGPGTFTVVLGVFHNAALDKTITLAITLWATQEAGQPTRFYSIAEGEQSIKADFSDFGTDMAKLKRRLRNDGVAVFDVFEKYGAAFKRHFGIGSAQAMDLFHRTVSMKQVENITHFVRTNMLEEDDVETRIKNLLHHFDDLKKAHDAVLRAKDQIRMLEPVRDNAARHHTLTAGYDRAHEQREQLSPWFTTKKLELSEAHLQEMERAAVRVAAEQNTLTADVGRLNRELADLRDDIRNSGGGRIAAIEGELARLAIESGAQRERYTSYSESATVLGLFDPENQVAFDANAAALPGVEKRLAEANTELQGQRTALDRQRSEASEQAGDHKTELKSLLNRQNLLPGWLIALRQKLCAGTGIAESELPFAGELLRVRESEAAWEGAAERTLHGFALSLLVTNDHYPAVSDWVERNNLRARIVYLKVGENPTPRPAAPDTLAGKIGIKPGTPLREFLLDELGRRFDHQCCETMAEFRRYPKALTINGQLKGGGGRHEKDDRKELTDRSSYVLGWDNHDKIARLRSALEEAEGRMRTAADGLGRIDTQLGNLGRQQRLIGTVAAVAGFAGLDWRSTARAMEDLAQEKAVLESSSDILRELTERESATGARLEKASGKLSALDRRIGSNEAEIKGITEQIADCRESLAEAPLTSDAGLLAELGTLARQALESEVLTYKNTAKIESKVRDKLTGAIDALNKQVIRAAETTIRFMSDFRNKYPAETTELDASLEAAGEFNTILQQLVENDLPRFAERFKESLTQNTIHEIVAFNAFLDARRQDIVSRIGEINESLARIEYNPGRHIQLEPQATSDAEVREFGSDLRACSEGSIGAQEQYSEQKFLQVEALVERFRGRAGLTNLDERWTAKVTDVRNWFTFSASERWTETGEEHEHFTDSGGKSGGQKEKLAYTILAAALAFQFGIAAGPGNQRSFRFVVIDEAFGRGSDESAKYGLELFKRLKLQLLIVTPLQKIHVIEPFVANVGFVANEAGDDSQLRNMTIHEYRAERDKRGS
ncbi:ATP-dependent exonuclease SbcCD, C subunit-like protein [Arthrobacter livingstonensis]|uniref:ATP-dependent exonuclease SbcCD, C subunit-like protein n=1 Tax=Arthrobacter livingstonensis TaxID=670078 RepID=A0A2V5LD57_9MICC|nr:SbcC/MukB-like Walker B domain-containing protein [Arthrobacter livingstonensis]PYI69585.1 ATP-dependent exonuclease SbcCD, C subunit-like protein [Arthrobacter livingstonensis]